MADTTAAGDNANSASKLLGVTGLFFVAALLVFSARIHTVFRQRQPGLDDLTITCAFVRLLPLASKSLSFADLMCIGFRCRGMVYDSCCRPQWPWPTRRQRLPPRPEIGSTYHFRLEIIVGRLYRVSQNKRCVYAPSTQEFAIMADLPLDLDCSAASVLRCKRHLSDATVRSIGVYMGSNSPFDSRVRGPEHRANEYVCPLGNRDGDRFLARQCTRIFHMGSSPTAPTYHCPLVYERPRTLRNSIQHRQDASNQYYLPCNRRSLHRHRRRVLVFPRTANRHHSSVHTLS